VLRPGGPSEELALSVEGKRPRCGMCCLLPFWPVRDVSWSYVWRTWNAARTWIVHVLLDVEAPPSAASASSWDQCGVVTKAGGGLSSGC
jgi:hypothetical protein